ncbi:spore germination protein [Paenibacillus sp. CCS19]|uniref:spore germination protein n=1 Tax=Paenibacillus sp. CCS19 TaxID=3158387 RepID=UPI002566FE95|nr:spore germination protein [Paenibacillus cellulosilyticus]GMK38639.1 spore germination protein [Paenibacillus cellulosilyticus]
MPDVNQTNSNEPTHTPISKQLEANRTRLEQALSKCSDLVYIPWKYGPNMEQDALSVYFQSMVQINNTNYMKTVLQDLVTHEVGPGTEITSDKIMSFFERNGVSDQAAQLTDDIGALVQQLLDGYFVILIDGWDKALVFETANVETRAITEPMNESVVQGPRESTVENMNKNLGLLRVRLRSPQFKLISLNGGGKTRTHVVYGYLEDCVEKELLEEFERRIDKVKQTEILETSYVEKLIQDSTYSPFPQFRFTERPDVAVASMLDGRIVVLVQGTGSMLICPSMFIDLLQSNEDFYHRTIYTTMIRWLRVIAFLFALTLPSIYIALSTFHSEMIPTVLLLAILDSREGIPFPAFFEAFIMEFFFELLREAGIRLPRPVGSAVSIVGALVIGEAAINAGLASPIMVVVVALTGIASFALPQYNMAIALRVLRFPLMVLSAVLGGFGLMFGLLIILWHLITLRSLGQPYMNPERLFQLHPAYSAANNKESSKNPYTAKP